MEDSYVLELTDRRFSELYLCFCGYAHCSPGHDMGPAVRPNYIIHYILSGKGVYQVGETTYYLEAGQGFLIEPEIQTYYRADKTEPWTYLWIGFGGKQAKSYLGDIGMDGRRPVFECQKGEELKQIVLEMLKHNVCTQTDQFCIQSLLYRFFAILSEGVKVQLKMAQSEKNYYVERAVEYIQNNYFNRIQIQDIASYVCINRSYLYTLFLEYLNVSPKEYLTNYRITQGTELLTTTRLSIKTIARSCGYEDALVFSKNFKAIKGMSPAVYRKEVGQGRRKKLSEKEEWII